MIDHYIHPTYTRTYIRYQGANTVPESAKYFAERLNHCLDESGAPAHVRERVAILSKMLDLPKQQAWSFLEGQQLPNSEQLNRIATEFEVETTWLKGEK